MTKNDACMSNVNMKRISLILSNVVLKKKWKNKNNNKKKTRETHIFYIRRQ